MTSRILKYNGWLYIPKTRSERRTKRDLLPCGDQPGNTEALLGLLKLVEFPITTEELTQLLSMIDITEEEAYVAIDRLGLSMSGGVYESIDETPALPE